MPLQIAPSSAVPKIMPMTSPKLGDSPGISRLTMITRMAYITPPAAGRFANASGVLWLRMMMPCRIVKIR
jgi:hypothetical protein